MNDLYLCHSNVCKNRFFHFHLSTNENRIKNEDICHVQRILFFFFLCRFLLFPEEPNGTYENLFKKKLKHALRHPSQPTNSTGRLILCQNLSRFLLSPLNIISVTNAQLLNVIFIRNWPTYLRTHHVDPPFPRSALRKPATSLKPLYLLWLHWW